MRAMGNIQRTLGTVGTLAVLFACGGCGEDDRASAAASGDPSGTDDGIGPTTDGGDDAGSGGEDGGPGPGRPDLGGGGDGDGGDDGEPPPPVEGCTDNGWELVVDDDVGHSFHVSSDGKRLIFPGGMSASDGTGRVQLRDDLILTKTSGSRPAHPTGVTFQGKDYVAFRNDNAGGILEIDAGGTPRIVAETKDLWFLEGTFVVHPNYTRDLPYGGSHTGPALFGTSRDSHGAAQRPRGRFLDGVEVLTNSVPDAEAFILSNLVETTVHGWREINRSTGKLDAFACGAQKYDDCRIEWVTTDIVDLPKVTWRQTYDLPPAGWDSTRWIGADELGAYVELDTIGPPDNAKVDMAIGALRPDGSVEVLWQAPSADGDMYKPLAVAAGYVWITRTNPDGGGTLFERVDTVTGAVEPIPFPDYFGDETELQTLVVNEATNCFYVGFTDGPGWAGSTSGDSLIARRSLH